MHARRLAQVFALSRVVVGSAMALAPGRIARPLARDDGDHAGTEWAMRALGVRDAALGAGLWLALADDADPSTWLAFGALADAVDGAGALIAGRRLPARAVALLGLGGPGFAVAGWWLRSRLGSRLGAG